LSIVIDSFTSATERHIEVSYEFEDLFLPTNNAQVGDGLEIYIVLAKGRTLHGTESIGGLQELTVTDDGERVFVVRRDLKKD
jgi:20S proteasome subunit beta 6